MATLAADVTKRDFLEDMFNKLVIEKHRLILGIAISLSEMKSFPDLEGWEESQDMIDHACGDTAKLGIELKKITRIFDEEKDVEIRRANAQRRVEDIKKANLDLQYMSNALQELSKDVGTQQAGYKFETWFYNLALFFEIVTRKSYTDKNGRQIDGAITLDGTTFLLEAKFRKMPIGSQEIEIFMNRVRCKTDNTMGLMVSISGFNPKAIETASQDRTPIILMDSSHLFNLVSPQILSLPEVIQRIWRNAAQTGRAFLPVEEFL